MTEIEIQNQLRHLASQRGGRLWRNNVGVAFNDKNQPVRFGLANDTPAMNRELKSGDLIGITPVIIQPQHVNTLVGVFTSIEVKREGWSYTGRGREKQQNAWIELISRLGGIAKFSTGDYNGL